MMINFVKLKICEICLTTIFVLVSKMHHFYMKTEHGIVLLNIFFSIIVCFSFEPALSE